MSLTIGFSLISAAAAAAASADTLSIHIGRRRKVPFILYNCKLTVKKCQNVHNNSGDVVLLALFGYSCDAGVVLANKGCLFLSIVD